MKTLFLFVVNAGLAMGAISPVFAGAAEARHLEPNAPRTVVVIETETPPVIRTGLLQSTLIMLPSEENIATVFGGDTISWVFDGGHVASRFISVKPKVANSTTDVHIISDHGNEYTLQLREITGDGDNHFDSKILLTPGDKAAKDRLAEAPVFVPASEVTRLQKETEAAKSAAETERKAAATEAEKYRSSYPGTLHFDYTWDQRKGSALGLQQVWRDEKFTYLRGQFQETPALYELKDGKGSLINFDFNAGLYTIPKTVKRGYLAIGKQKVEFEQVGEGN
jgi:type IV secretion system protein VirB9